MVNITIFSHFLGGRRLHKCVHAFVTNEDAISASQSVHLQLCIKTFMHEGSKAH